MMGAPCFYYLLRTQYENLGDRIINRECLALLRQYGPVRVNVAGVPESFLAGLNLQPGEAEGSSLAFYKQMITDRRKGAKVFMVLVPGAVMGDATPAQAVRQKILVVGYAALQSLGIRIVRLGASLGPFTPRRLQIERRKAQTMAFIGLRDSRSMRYASDNGIPNTHSFRDFAFMLPMAPRAVAADQGDIIMSFRAGNEAEMSEIADSIARYLERVDPDSRRGLVIASQVERDRATGAALAKRVAGGRTVSFVDADDGEEVLFARYGTAAVVLSNRLHVLMFAMSRRAPVRALVHPDRNQKIIGLFEDAGFTDRLVDISTASAVDTIPWPDQPIDMSIVKTEKRALVAATDVMLRQK